MTNRFLFLSFIFNKIKQKSSNKNYLEEITGLSYAMMLTCTEVDLYLRDNKNKPIPKNTVKGFEHQFKYFNKTYSHNMKFILKTFNHNDEDVRNHRINLQYIDNVLIEADRVSGIIKQQQQLQQQDDKKLKDVNETFNRISIENLYTINAVKALQYA